MLARFEANNDVAHLDAESLNLTEEEGSAIVKLTLGERQLTAKGLAQLHKATHGWVAGLLLALRELRARAEGDEAQVIEAITRGPADDPARIFNYFATEVLARLDPPTREFLCAVALFPAMSANLCEQLTGNSKAKKILQRLVQEHFFTTRRGLLSVTYEFHPLFRQFLLAQGDAQWTPPQRQALRRKAGQLLAEAGEAETAAALLVAAQDWPAIVELVKLFSAELEKQGRHETLKQWIQALPEALRESDPWLLYWSATAAMANDLHRAYEYFERAYRCAPDAIRRYATSPVLGGRVGMAA